MDFHREMGIELVETCTYDWTTLSIRENSSHRLTVFR